MSRPQVLISADVIKGRKLTSYISVKEEILNANGNYRDEEVVIDRNLVSSRHPGDLPYFTKAFLSQLQKWEQNINRTVG
jgi:protease I